jgi:hypothetical protein
VYVTYTTVVGNLATRVDLRSVPDGTPVASFRVASNERHRDRATGSWRDGDTLYVNVTCWRSLAENVHASVGVGDPVVVHGPCPIQGSRHTHQPHRCSRCSRCEGGRRGSVDRGPRPGRARHRPAAVGNRRGAASGALRP